MSLTSVTCVDFYEFAFFPDKMINMLPFINDMLLEKRDGEESRWAIHLNDGEEGWRGWKEGKMH